VAIGQQARLEIFTGHRVLEQVDQVRIEHRAAVASQHLTSLRGAQRLAEGVARVLREIGVRIGDGEQARAEGNFLGGRAVGKALAVVALVHVLEGLPDLERQLHGLEQAQRALVLLLGLRLVTLVLGHVERRQVIRAHLAQVVQVGGHDVSGLGRLGKADAFGDLLGQARDGGGVTAQIGSRIFDQRDQDVQRFLKRFVVDAAAAASSRFMRKIPIT
jgi:hypothetical protein